MWPKYKLLYGDSTLKFKNKISAQKGTKAIVQTLDETLFTFRDDDIKESGKVVSLTQTTDIIFNSKFITRIFVEYGKIQILQSNFCEQMTLQNTYIPQDMVVYVN